jgi:F0F1-type ATP synthase delta subunit
VVYQQRSALKLLQIAMLSDAQKQEIMREWVVKYDNVHTIVKLIDILIVDKRLSLLPMIMDQIIRIVLKQFSIMQWHISSAQELSDAHKQQLTSWLSEETGASVDAQYSIDQSLIAGIRAVSDTYYI